MVVDSGGNFILIVMDFVGLWFEFVWLLEVGGIDLDIFFDDNGKVYIVYNDVLLGEFLYNGYRVIWLWEFDLIIMKVVFLLCKLLVNGGVDISQKLVWIEGLYIYKKDGWYYLICVEGGIGLQYFQVVF